MATPNPVDFHFSDASLVSLDRIRDQCVEFSEITVKDFLTGEERVIYIPVLKLRHDTVSRFQPLEFLELTVRDPQTGEERAICVPEVKAR